MKKTAKSKIRSFICQTAHCLLLGEYIMRKVGHMTSSGDKGNALTLFSSEKCIFGFYKMGRGSVYID